MIALFKKLQKKQTDAFTLLEMMLVLIIISVLILLFVPNLTKQKEMVNEKGNAAIVKVVETQAELYQLNRDEAPSLSQLVQNGNITQKQADAYNSYYQTHDGRQIAN